MRRMASVVGVALLTGALGVLGCGERPEAPAVSTSQLRSAEGLAVLVRSQVEKRRVNGMVVGVLEADGLTRVAAYGDPGTGARALDSRSLFEIGSATKVFTGTLLADMAGRHEVALDDPVSKYLPEHVAMPSRGGRQITLVDLATHHSGLPRMPEDFKPADPANPYADFTLDRMYAFLSRYELRRDIGSHGEYSNLGMGLLGHVLARAAGRTYEEVVRERILEPLGMRMTGISLKDEIQELMVKGHGRDGRVVPLYDAPAIAGAGALRSNAEDLLKFLAANVGPPTSLLERAMRASHAVQKRLTSQLAIGLAWQVATDGGCTVVHHGGGTGGFQSFVGFDPNTGVGAVVLINTKSGDRHDAQEVGMHLINPSCHPLR